MDMGADDYLTKPFDEQELLSAIESRLAKASILAMRESNKQRDNAEDDENPQNLNQLKNFFCDEGEVSNYKKGETIYRKGDHSNSMFLIPYNETATAVEETEVVGISKTYVRDILKKSQDVSLELMNLLTDNLSEIKQQLVKMAYSSVRKKTASTILQFVEIMDKKPEAPLRISRNDLATTAGIATESLIRTLSDFKKDGRDIRIVDLESLRDID